MNSTSPAHLRSLIPALAMVLLPWPVLAEPAPAALPGAATAGQASSNFVIPPGQEPLIQKLVAVPGHPAPDFISIRKDHVIVNWPKPSNLRLTLQHPQAPPPAGARSVGATTRFGVFIDADMSEGHQAALLSHIGANEGAFSWHVPARTPPKGNRVDATAEAALQRIISSSRTSLRIGERDKAMETARAGKPHVTARALTRARLGALLVELGDKEGVKVLADSVKELASQAKGNPAAALDHLAALALVEPEKAARMGQERIAGLSGDAACAWVALADTLGSAGKRGEGQRIADAVAKLAPKCKNAWLTAGGLLPHKEGGSKRALEIADQALAQLPDDPQLLFMKASALHGLWRNEEAAALWEKVVAADVQHPGAIGMLATAYTQGGQVTDDAFLRRFEERIAKNPKDIAARYVKGTIHYYRGDYAQVLEYLEPLFKVVPREPRIWLYTAMSHFNLGRVDEADKLLERIAALAHDDPDYYYCRSVVTRKRNFEASLRDLETFVRLSRERQNSAAKVAKVERELEVMRTGRVPTAWDLWPASLRWGLPAALLLLLAGVGVWLVRRRR